MFLPLVLDERCDPTHKGADAAPVIDTSGSMAGQKLADAKSAVALFVDLIDLAPGRGQVTVVRFDTTAEVIPPLSSDRQALEGAIARLTSRQATHIDAGLRTSLGALQGNRHNPANTRVTVVLTDGIQTGTPGDELTAAAEVRAARVVFYTIGLRADVDAAALRAKAGDDSR